MQVYQTAPVEEEDLDRPVTLREFRNEFKMLIEKITADRLQDRKEREEEKAKEASDRAEEKAKEASDRAEEKAKEASDRAEEKAQAEADRIKRKALKQAEAEQERIDRDEMKAAERENVQRLWGEGKMVECLMLFFKMNQGNYYYHCCNDYQRIKVE